MNDTVFVRYGVVSEVGRFRRTAQLPLRRGQSVIVQTERGWVLGTVLELVEQHAKTESAVPMPRNGSHSNERDEHAEATDGHDADSEAETIVRIATAEDEALAVRLQEEAQHEFNMWTGRIREWNLQLELIDLERTIDNQTLILYVLSDRGPDCTKLALNAAAAGFSGIKVQPVNAEGLVVQQTSGGGCGSGGSCGCH